VDNNQRIAQAFAYRVSTAVKPPRGKVADEFTGRLPESQVRAWLKRVLPAAVRMGYSPAAAALAQHDPSEAAARYRLALGEIPATRRRCQPGSPAGIPGHPEGVRGAAPGAGPARQNHRARGLADAGRFFAQAGEAPGW